MLMCFNEIANNPRFNVTARDEARTLMEKMTKFETILTAATFNRIFAITTPLSEYLQTSGLDVLQSWRMVESALGKLEGISRYFSTVLEVATQFATNSNSRLASLNCHVEVEESLPSKRIRRKKLPFGETDDGNNSTHNGIETYQVEIYNVVMDQVVTSINCRFVEHEKLYQGFAVLDPCRFDECREAGLPQKAFESICQTLGKHVDPVKLREQLLDFYHSFPKLVKTLPETLRSAEAGNVDQGFEDSETDSNSSDDESRDISFPCQNKSCKSCFNCAYKLLHEYGLNSSAYTELYTAYKYLVTLAVTQVECERSFSTLKFVKNRLRSTISQEHLEALMNNWMFNCSNYWFILLIITSPMRCGLLSKYLVLRTQTGQKT